MALAVRLRWVQPPAAPPAATLLRVALPMVDRMAVLIVPPVATPHRVALLPVVHSAVPAALPAADSPVVLMGAAPPVPMVVPTVDAVNRK